MLNIHYQGRNVVLKNLVEKDLLKVFIWYNDIEEFGYATGFDTKISMEKLLFLYEQIVKDEKKFLTGIYQNNTNVFLGIIKGTLIKGKKGVVWINSIIIDKKHQEKGYGRESIRLLSEYFQIKQEFEEFYISVAKKNKKGEAFWQKLGFDYTETLQNHLKRNEDLEKILIMKRQIMS